MIFISTNFNIEVAMVKKNIGDLEKLHAKIYKACQNKFDSVLFPGCETIENGFCFYGFNITVENDFIVYDQLFLNQYDSAAETKRTNIGSIGLVCLNEFPSSLYVYRRQEYTSFYVLTARKISKSHKTSEDVKDTLLRYAFHNNLKTKKINKGLLKSWFAKHLHPLLKKDLLSITLKIFGFSATIDHYNFVVKNQNVIKKLLLSNSTSISCIHLFLGLNKSMFSNYFEPKINDKLFLTIKNYFIKAGYSPACFRSFIKLSPGKMKAYVSYFSVNSEGLFRKPKKNKISFGVSTVSIFLSKNLSSKKIRFLLDQKHFQVCRGNNISIEQSCKYLNLILDNTFHLPDDVFKQKVNSIVDYILASTIDDTQIGYKKLNARAEQWHENIQKINAASVEEQLSITWETPISSFSQNEYEFVSLHTGKSLFEEGKKMVHCVFSFIDKCSNGHSRIYSIRNISNDLLYTLELKNDYQSKKWIMGQLHGYDNSSVKDKKLKNIITTSFIPQFNKKNPLNK